MLQVSGLGGAGPGPLSYWMACSGCLLVTRITGPISLILETEIGVTCICPKSKRVGGKVGLEPHTPSPRSSYSTHSTPTRPGYMEAPWPSALLPTEGMVEPACLPQDPFHELEAADHACGVTLPGGGLCSP